MNQRQPAGRIARRIATVVLFVLALDVSAGMMPGDPRVLQAKLLIDASDGDRGKLVKAAELLKPVLAEDPGSTDANVEAARIALKASVASGRVRPELLQPAEQHLATALTTFPDFAPALSLQAEIRMLQGRMPDALALLQRARKIDPMNPWVRMNLGRYHEALGDWRQAHEEYRQVVQWGRDGRFDQALAYPHALAAYAERLYGTDREDLHVLAQAAETTRQPGTAYIPRTFSRLFVAGGEFDDAITLARKSFAIEDSFDSRQALGNALYGKAALMQVQGKEGSRALVDEAASLQTNPGLTLCAFLSADGNVRDRLLPTVRALLPSPTGPARQLYAQSGCTAARQG